MKAINAFMFSLVIGLAAGCSGGGSGDGSGSGDNAAPLAVASSSLAGSVGSTFTLDGTKSSDANGDTLSYSWAITSRPPGSTASITGATSAKASLVPDFPGTYVVALTVSDGITPSAPSTVSLVVGARVFVAGSGKLTTDIAPDAKLDAVAVQFDGKILAAGHSSVAFQSSTPILVRYNADGSLDNAFGLQGKAVVKVPQTLAAFGEIIPLPNGKTLASGLGFLLARFNSDGSLDSSFGQNGLVLNPNGDSGTSLATDASGRIYIEASRSTSALQRFSAEGVLDTSFGVGGSIPSLGAADRVKTLQGGKFIVVGTTGNVDGSSNFVVSKYNADGTVDLSFGVNGRASTKVLGFLTLQAPLITADAKIILTGSLSGQNIGTVAIVKYNPDGSVDTSFGVHGSLVTSVTGFGLRATALQPDGKILLGGTSTGGQRDFGVVRLNVDGSIDMSWGNAGLVTTDFGVEDEVRAITVQSDGKIIAAGSTGGGTFAIARYLSNGTLDK